MRDNCKRDNKEPEPHRIDSVGGIAHRGSQVEMDRRIAVREAGARPLRPDQLDRAGPAQHSRTAREVDKVHVYLLALQCRVAKREQPG